VRQPAAFCGLYGLKPTYGHLSRYGLTAYASSLEVAGLLARSVDLVEAAFAACRGADPMDQTSVDAPADAPAAAAKTVAVLKADSGLHPAVAAAYKSTAAKLAKMGYAVREVELPLLKYAVPSYYTIAAAEASANLARYNGIRYGFHPYHAETPRELIERARSEGFGDEVKLRVMLGTFVLRSGFQEQYYEKAQKVRTALARSFEALFAEHDLLLSPVFPTPAFLIDDPGMDGFAQKLADVYTVSANLAGLPALSFPAALADGLPIGLQLTGPRFAETRLLSLARVLEADFPAPPCPAAPGGRP
jgi:aspartyl-tRNA(Asn)/glutamyl-tRNA(Gln) amidotransferase subunit A